jgi:hypothetical protein
VRNLNKSSVLSAWPQRKRAAASRPEGEALQEILHVDGRIGGCVVRDEVECLGGRLVEDVKVGRGRLCWTHTILHRFSSLEKAE